MMGIQLPGNDFQDMSGALPIVAVEELMAPIYLDDCFIETNINNNNSDFDANKGTHNLHGLNEMTINQMNVDFAEQLQPEQQFMKEVPGEEELFNMLRMPHSEELVTLTQPSFEHETLGSESHFLQLDEAGNNIIINNNNNNNINDIIAFSEDSNNSSSYIDFSPASPVLTENDCIATAELHNNKYMDENSISMQNDETSYLMEFFLNESSPLSRSDSVKNEETRDITQIIQELCSPQQSPNLKRSRDHLSNTQTKMPCAKKCRLNIPIIGTTTDARCGSTLATRVPDTPEVCELVYKWMAEDNDISLQSYPSSPSWSATPIAPSELIEDQFTLIDNPPSIASYTYDEPLYATPSPSDRSCTPYSTNPSSPAFSAYGSGSSKKPRGRPPKQHSDMPDPNLLRQLPESERKRIEDRCKNNEASRQSRQKNKEKQMILLADEEREQRINDELKIKLESLERVRRKLEKSLHANWKKDH